MGGLLLPLGGLVLAFVGHVWIIITAFQKHPAWGIPCIIPIPLIGWIFCLNYWEEGKQPFLVSFAGVVILVMDNGM